VNALKKIYYQVRNRLLRGKKPSYDINFCTDFFIRQLRITDSITPQHLAEALAEPDSERAFQNVVNYFSQRKTFVAFLTPEKVNTLVADITSKHPGWKARTLARVTRETTVALDIYGMKSPALDTDYPWAGTHDTPGKDLQYRKRPHRFGFLPRMALASLYDRSITENIKEVLLSWMQFAESEPGSRLAYDSNLAVIQRLMASVWAWLYIRSGSLQQREQFCELEGLLLTIIFTDIQFLSLRLGKSYGNNHLLADYFAGWFICKLFPEFANVGYQEQDFEQLWIDELFRQTYEDGCSFEQSTHYHEFACDMGLSYLLLNRCNGWKTSAVVEERIKKMLLLQAEIGGNLGAPLRLGDCIEENFFPLGVHEGLGPSLYREVYRGLFDPKLAAADISRPEVECAYWLLGGLTEAQSQPQSRSEITAGITTFKQGGLYAVRNPQSNMELLFRTGPSANTNICAGHAHADWMTVYLSVDEQPVIVDAGTYSYRSALKKWPDGEPGWRQYFRGPESHNGVVIEAQDPLGIVNNGDFRPKHIDARVQAQIYADTPIVSWLAAEYSDVEVFAGYVRGVVCIPGNYMVIYDVHPRSKTLDWAGMQFAPGVGVSKDANGRVLKIDAIDIVASSGIRDIELHCGSTKPLAGWVSDTYGVLEKAPQARFNFDQQAQQTAFLVARSGDCDRAVEVDKVGPLQIFKITQAEVHDCLILSDKVNYTATSYEELTIDARLFWVRTVAKKLTELRAADVKRLVIAGQLKIDCSEPETWMSLSLSEGELSVHTASGKAPRIEWN